MSADLPLTADELATIRARGRRVASIVPPGRTTATMYMLGAVDVPRMVAEIERLRALPDMTLGWDSQRGVLVFTDYASARRVTLREWIDGQ